MGGQITIDTLAHWALTFATLITCLLMYMDSKRKSRRDLIHKDEKCLIHDMEIKALQESLKRIEEVSLKKIDDSILRIENILLSKIN